MRRYGLMTAVVLGMGLVGPTAWAQFQGREFTATAFLGAVRYDLTDVYFDVGIDLPPRLIWGLGVGYTVFPRLSLEAVGVYNPDDMDTPTRVGYGFNHIYGLFGAAFHVTPGRTFVPYLTAGGGLARIVPETGNSFTKPVFHVGAGFDFFGSPHWTARVDLRVVSYRYRGQDLDYRTLGLDPGVRRQTFHLLFLAGMRWKS